MCTAANPSYSPTHETPPPSPPPEAATLQLPLATPGATTPPTPSTLPPPTTPTLPREHETAVTAAPRRSAAGAANVLAATTYGQLAPGGDRLALNCSNTGFRPLGAEKRAEGTQTLLSQRMDVAPMHAHPDDSSNTLHGCAGHMCNPMPTVHPTTRAAPLRIVAHEPTQSGMADGQCVGPLMWGYFHAMCLDIAKGIASTLYMPRHAWHGLAGDQQSLNPTYCIRAQDRGAEASYRAVLGGRAQTSETLARGAACYSTNIQHHIYAIHQVRTALWQPVDRKSGTKPP